MKKVEILIIGTNEPIMKTIARLIDRDGEWLATIAISIKEAVAICKVKKFELILMCAGIDNNEIVDMQHFLNKAALNIPIIKHYGGGSGLLFAEIYQALNAKR